VVVEWWVDERQWLLGVVAVVLVFEVPLSDEMELGFRHQIFLDEAF
jgi:hypothetical protein